MPIQPGTLLGTCEILGPLGAGGMGEVYRAHDRNLHRDVAIKVLPERLARDPVALARFEREAHAVAAISHPNIVAIYDFQRDGATAYTVMELLDGATLRQKLADGPLPTRKAVDIAIGVARGMAAAHARGIVHRDLKPENIIVTNDGVVKVLDFGLARATGPGGETTAEEAVTETLPGTVMGTVGYMSPEQVRGESADARTDLFALGAVLYEMLSGERAFRRATAVETMSAILKEDPPEFAAARSINRALDRIVRHCLEKSPADRFQTARDVAFALESLTETTSSTTIGAAVPKAARMSRERIGWAAAVVALAAIAGWFGSRSPGAVSALDGAKRATIQLPPGTSFREGLPGDKRMALSPDGRRIALALASLETAENALYVHSFETGVTALVPDTQNAWGSVWSPDGVWVTFRRNGQLMRVKIDGGRPEGISFKDGRVFGLESWGPTGDWLLASGNKVHFVPSGSAELREIGGKPDGVERLCCLNWFADGRRFFLAGAEKGSNVPTQIYVGDTSGAPWRRMLNLENARNSANFAQVGDYVIGVANQTLTAYPLTTDGFAASEGFNLAGPVETVSSIGSAVFSAVPTTVVYQPAPANARTRMLWYDRSGGRLSQLSDDAVYTNLEISPDGGQLLAGVYDPDRRGNDIWGVDLKRGIRSRLTSDPGDERSAAWTADGKSFVFRGANQELFIKPLGAGEARGYQVDGQNKDPRSFSPDGAYFVYRVSSVGRRGTSDIWIKPANPPGEARPLIATPFDENYAEISPDGRWMAYVSNESGQPDVYVTAFPSAAGKWRVSPEGGTLPRWRRDTRELYYIAPNRTLMRAAVRPAAAAFDWDPPMPLFETEIVRTAGSQYVVSPDGQRFLINTESPSPERGYLSVIFNWQALVKKAR